MQAAQLPDGGEILSLHMAYRGFIALSRAKLTTRDLPYLMHTAAISGGGLGPLNFTERAMLLHLLKEPCTTAAFRRIFARDMTIFDVRAQVHLIVIDRLTVREPTGLHKVL